VVNGVLLGREYAQLVALRRSDAAGAAAFRKRHRPTIFAAGVLMAVPLTIPVVNLLVPILGAATFTHLYHRLTRTTPSPSRTA
jgi:CysZ protein